jgi:hypothetical protein
MVGAEDSLKHIKKLSCVAAKEAFFVKVIYMQHLDCIGTVVFWQMLFKKLKKTKIKI